MYSRVVAVAPMLFVLIRVFSVSAAQSVAAFRVLPLPVSLPGLRKNKRLWQGSLLLATSLVVIGGHAHRLRAQALEGTVPEAGENLKEQLESPLEPTFPSPPASTPTIRTGPFRVGNRTPYPIRLVILLRAGERLLNPETAHWDFAPGEGGSEGLVLSLGEDPLQIGPGDIVVAFTLDGSRRYWGPNVVGESLAPFWNAESGSWSMILQP
ncbi:MAG: hypothetical protein Q6K80_04040 [Thermostichus sp. DG_1_6_bins_120]